MYATDSHKVYYGIFISRGISGTCTKILGAQANWPRLQARPQAASRGPFRPRVFQLDQPDDATLECSIGSLQRLPCCAQTEAVSLWSIQGWHHQADPAEIPGAGTGRGSLPPLNAP